MKMKSTIRSKMAIRLAILHQAHESVHSLGAEA